MTDYTELRQALKPLPKVRWSKTRSTVTIPETEDFAGTQLPITGLDKQYARRLAAFIAAASPATIAALLDEIDALRAELQARQWQPIETAPHETLLVLGWYEGEVFKQEIALASAGERHPDGYSNRWWHGRATHWMPLPPAPPQGE